MPAVRFQQVVTGFSHRAERWVVNILQCALPTMIVLYAGLFTRMANVTETLVIFFVYTACICFSLFASSMLRLFDAS